MTIDLFLTGGAETISWSAGSVIGSGRSVAELRDALAGWRDTNAEAILLWDARLGAPDPVRARRLLGGTADVWHAGLALGTSGQPGMLDFVSPNWMFNCDPPRDRESTSWRVTPAACLIRRSALDVLGGPEAQFETTGAAMLEWAHRAIVRGALLRHVPELAGGAHVDLEPPTLADELRLIAYRYGRKWARWAIARAIATSYATPSDLVRAWRTIPAKRPYDEPPPVEHDELRASPDVSRCRVTVLIPTLERYPYLLEVLRNLRAQTVPPYEVIVVDQTARVRRDETLAQTFSDLPIRFIYQDEPGQCASRNAGLAQSSGDYVLFLDDDDEVPPSLIEQHLVNLTRFAADTSSGVAIEVGTVRSGDQRFVRASDVFPTGNTMVRRDVLKRSGLFDLAFNRAPRADGELGMRVYCSGALMVFDPDIYVMHHRAPSGGLREHGARIITYRTSRESLSQRHLPHISEIYLAARHFTPRQQREMLWLRAIGTLSGRGSPARRLAKMVVGGFLLPDTLKQTRERRREAEIWLAKFPQIASLDS